MSLDIFSQFATDENLENNGAEFELADDAKLVVARSGNKAYAKELTKLYERHQKVLERKDDVADAKSEEIMVDVMARTVLLGWSNLSFQGKPIEYSVENAKKLLAVRDFRRLVARFSEDFEAFKIKEEVAQGEA